MAVACALAACAPDLPVGPPHPADAQVAGFDGALTDRADAAADAGDAAAAAGDTAAAAGDTAAAAGDVAAAADAGADGTGGTDATAAVDTGPAPKSCPPYFVLVAVNGGAVCAPDAPVWGIAPLSPITLTDNGDGTVTDSLTRLQWQRVPSADLGDWWAAQGYCDDLVLAGHDDWRLPTDAELQTTIDAVRVDTAVAAPFPAPAQDDAWYSAVTGYPWANGPFIVRSDGSEGPKWPGTDVAAARCVRALQPWTAPSAPRWQIGKNAGTVRDTWTQRTWQRVPANGELSWPDAQSYCAALPLDGGGWRLPDVRELSSFVGRTLHPQVEPLAFAPAGDAYYYWSVTPAATYPGAMWGVRTVNQPFTDPLKTDGWQNSARCVR